MVTRDELIEGEFYLYYEARDIHIFEVYKDEKENNDSAGRVLHRIKGSGNYEFFFIHKTDLDRILKIENITLSSSQEYYIKTLFEEDFKRTLL